jgi:signal transduction histidine kinase/ligand-binding sensor domain-containing protein
MWRMAKLRARWVGVETCWRWLTGALLVLMFASPGLAADAAWSVRTWQIDDGSNNAIVGIAQSPDGYLWIATVAGLNRFDSLHLEHHVVGNLFTRANPNVRGILASRDGGLWVVLDGAVVLLKGDAPPVIVRDNIPSLRFDSLAEDDHGALWIGYHANVICRVKDGKATVLGSDAGIPKGFTSSLAVDNSGQVWLAEGDQIGIIRNGYFIRKTTGPDSCSLARASDGGLWVCAGLSLYKYDGGDSLKLVGALPLSRQIRNRNTTAMIPFEDRYGTVWIGTVTDGLFQYDHHRFEKVGIPQVKITCFAEDHEGNLWVGTDAGVDRVSPRTVDVEGFDADPPYPSVQSICQARDGQMWATIANGAVMVRKLDQWMPCPFKVQGDASCVAGDSTGAIWVGTNNRRMYRWKSGEATVWGESQGLKSHYVTAILPVAGGDTWIAATAPEDQIFRLHDGQLVPYRLFHGVHRIDAIAQDHDGNLWMGWVGTRLDTGGLLEIAGDHIIDQRGPSGIQAPVQALCVTDDNTLLIGCRLGKLGWFKNGSFGSITTQQGLYDDDITQIVAGDDGCVWFGSAHGIFKIRQKQLSEFAAGKSAGVQSIVYGPDEGLPPLQGIRGTSSAVRARDGRIWLAMATGLAIINPERVREPVSPAPVCIERVIVDGRVAAAGADYFAQGTYDAMERRGFVLRLPPDYHRLEFDFAELTFSSPENARFRYRLDGFDEDWTEISQTREAIYPRLPAGSYRFHVAGCGADGKWSTKDAEIAVTVDPFIWQFWWFQLGALALFSLILLLVVRYLSFRWLRRRLEIAERRGALDRERDRIARDIHDDLGHGLTQIVLLSELTLHNHIPPDEHEEYLEQIVTTAKQGLRSLDETVWAINPRNDTLPDLVDYLGHFVMKSLGTAHIKCRLDLPDYPPNRTVAAEVRHSLFLVVKEAINNIICHASAKSVQMTAKVTDDALSIVIEDDGQGFAFGESSPGQDGLLNMRQRMTDIGGVFHIDSRLGAGTRISLTHYWRARSRITKMALSD